MNELNAMNDWQAVAEARRETIEYLSERVRTLEELVRADAELLIATERNLNTAKILAQEWQSLAEIRQEIIGTKDDLIAKLRVVLGETLAAYEERVVADVNPGANAISIAARRLL